MVLVCSWSRSYQMMEPPVCQIFSLPPPSQQAATSLVNMIPISTLQVC